MQRGLNNIREGEIFKLKNMLKNPGFFPILILGESGTGKEYILNNLLSNVLNNKNKNKGDEDIDKSKNKENKDKINPLELEEILSKEQKKDLKFNKYFPFEIGNSVEEINEIFINDIIFIKDVETLTPQQQNILFKALSTTDGKVGLKKRDFKRIIFTSTFNVEQLRESKEYLSDRFWDRISQLVVEIPSFKDFSAQILDDFESVWTKMDFEKYNKIPEDGEFQNWLKNNCKTFTGNFRDLDKIAILWHQYRIMEYSEKTQKFKADVEARIFRKVRKDFEELVHSPIQKADSTNIFEFEKGKTWEQIERNFRSKFKKWAKETYGTIKNATKELNMPYRKMDKW